MLDDKAFIFDQINYLAGIVKDADADFSLDDEASKSYSLKLLIYKLISGLSVSSRL